MQARVQHGFLVAALAVLAPATGAQTLALSEQVQQQWLPRFAIGQENPAASARPVASLLNDRFLFGGARLGRTDQVSGLRASGGLVAGAGSAWLAAAAAQPGPFTTLGARASALAAAGNVPGARGGLPQLGADVPSLQPYVGIGYTHQADDGSWGLSADLGLAATGSETWQDWGRALLGPSRLDEAVRNLKMRPVLQLGLRYRF